MKTMLRIFVISSTIIGFVSNTCYAQDSNTQEKIYLRFFENEKDYAKCNSDKGIVFKIKDHEFINLYKKQRDTFNIEDLNNFEFTDLNNLSTIEKKWVSDNKESEDKRVEYRLFGKNAIFDVRIIEKLGSDKIVVYEAKWRQQKGLKTNKPTNCDFESYPKN